MSALSYQKLDLVQGSLEWKEARLKHLTASQAPVLFDLSDYQTRLQLFEEKITGKEQDHDEYKLRLFQKAHEAEKAGREWAKSNFKLNLVPLVVVSVPHPDLLASLDGFDEERNVGFEAKYVGRDHLKRIDSGEISPSHLCQIQAQLRATNADSWIYFAMDDDGNAVHHTVRPDKVYGDEIAGSAAKFMNQVRAGEAPEPSERDYLLVQDERFQKLAELKRNLDLVKDEYDALEDALKAEFKQHPRVRCGDVSIVRYIQKGNIDYKKIPQLKGIDLEKFRKGFIEKTRVTIKRGAQ